MNEFNFKTFLKILLHNYIGYLAFAVDGFNNDNNNNNWFKVRFGVGRRHRGPLSPWNQELHAKSRGARGALVLISVDLGYRFR